MGMGSAEIRQRARQQALGAARRQRQEQARRERRMRDLVEQVLTAIGERDAAVAAAEQRAGDALAQMTDVEGLTLAQVVDWCGDDLSAREATRLRRLATTNTTTNTTTPRPTPPPLRRRPRRQRPTACRSSRPTRSRWLRAGAGRRVPLRAPG